MRITFKPIVRRHQQRKDKTFPVIIRIGWQSKYIFYPTKLSISKTGLSRTLEIKNSDIIDQCNILISEYRKITDKIHNIEELSLQDIIEIIKHKTSNPNEDVDFMCFFERHIVKLKSIDSPSIQIYQATFNHLEKHIGSKSYSIKKISPKFLSDFEDYLKNKKIGSRGQNLYLGKIRTVYNLIIDEYEHYGYTFNYPFRKYKLPKVKTPKTIALTKEQLQSIINIDLTGKIRAQRAKCAFIISLLTLGTNATDLYDLSVTNNNRIEYKRNKTKDRRDDEAFISIKIEPELLPYIELAKGNNGFLFCFREWYKNKKQFNKGIDEGLKQIVSMINIQHKGKEDIKDSSDTPFIPDFDFYDARRTMASVMRNRLSISKDDVALCLNHIDMEHKTTDFYIETDFSILDNCNRKFIDWIFDSEPMLG